MSTINYLALRSTIMYSAAGTKAPPSAVFVTDANSLQNFTTTPSVSSLTVASQKIALGNNAGATQSANQSSGTFSNWITAKSSLTNVKKIAVSATGQYQVAILQSALWYSSDSGVTWTQPTAYGLPLAEQARGRAATRRG